MSEIFLGGLMQLCSCEVEAMRRQDKKKSIDSWESNSQQRIAFDPAAAYGPAPNCRTCTPATIPAAESEAEGGWKG
eukprot:138769-Rhodomonas_salina.2